MPKVLEDVGPVFDPRISSDNTDGVRLNGISKYRHREISSGWVALFKVPQHKFPTRHKNEKIDDSVR